MSDIIRPLEYCRLYSIAGGVGTSSWDLAEVVLFCVRWAIMMSSAEDSSELAAIS